MGEHYLIKWRNPEARGSVDLIEANLLEIKTTREKLTHATICNGVVVTSTFAIELDGDALLFRYGGDHRAANEKQRIFIGDMRIVPSEFAAATELGWRDGSKHNWVMLPVEIVRLGSEEGTRREHSAIYISRDRALAIRKRGDAKAKGGLKCEACGFTGHSAYGDAGERCFEVHHKRAVAEGERETKLDDLAIVCANCHNVIHGRNDESFDHFARRFRT